MEADVNMVGAFTTQAALALKLAETRLDNEQLRLVDDRLRIAKDLQDKVIRRLFALGLSLQGVAGQVGNQRTRPQLTAAIEEVDQIIGDIRSAVFALDRPGTGDDPQPVT